MRKELGKIQSAVFGYGGYQDAMIGVSFILSGEGWGVTDFWGDWAVKRSDGAKWSEDDRIKLLGAMVMRLNTLLSQAKVTEVNELIGIPVEVTFENNTLQSWRVLKEVL